MAWGRFEVPGAGRNTAPETGTDKAAAPPRAFTAAEAHSGVLRPFFG